MSPSASASLANSADQLVLETLQQLFGFELTDEQTALARRRLADGGLGLRRRGGSFAAAARLAS
eukprot:9361309-Karenia_brevis.AAC.1